MSRKVQQHKLQENEKRPLQQKKRTAAFAHTQPLNIRKRNQKKLPLSKSVGAIVLNYHSYVLLLFQRKNKYWEFPKGKMEIGEREIDTLKRELFEETGIRRYRLLRSFHRSMYYNFRYKGKLIPRKVVYFLVKTSDHIQLSHEHTRYEWLPLEKAKKRLKHKNQIALIDAVIKQMIGS